MCPGLPTSVSVVAAVNLEVMHELVRSLSDEGPTAAPTDAIAGLVLATAPAGAGRYRLMIYADVPAATP